MPGPDNDCHAVEGGGREREGGGGGEEGEEKGGGRHDSACTRTQL